MVSSKPMIGDSPAIWGCGGNRDALRYAVHCLRLAVSHASSLPHAVAATPRNQPRGAGARLMLICFVSR